MIAITVCVDYGDLLAITLKQNRKFFDSYYIITSFSDHETQALSRYHNCTTYITNDFYLNGAAFNKGLAIENTLNANGIKDYNGWVTILDADILLPKTFEAPPGYLFNDLFVPRRRMVDHNPFTDCDWDWSRLPVNQENDFAGYCQMFYPASVHLPRTGEWYGTKWKHAGGCDTDFEKHFPRFAKHRPPFTVMHLGLDHLNWCGRVTERIDGKAVPNREKHQALHKELLSERKPNYEGERIQ